MGVRKIVLPLVVISLIFVTLGLSVDAFAQNPNEQLPAQIQAPDRLIIKFNPGVSQETKNSIISGQQSTVISDLPKMDVKIIKVPEQAIDSIKEALSKNHNVEYAAYDVAAPPSVTPDDPSFANEWFLPKINSEGAWDITKGSTDRIVILDSGIDMNHPDLQSKIFSPYNGLTLIEAPVDHQNGCGHGTPVAGSAAAFTNNGVGVAGVGWDTQIIPIKITDDSASGPTQCYGWSSGVLNGVYWAVEKGARVANLSYGFGSGTGQINTAAQYMQDNGGWLVISAGNSGGFVGDPDNYKVINVASTTSSDTRSSFSSYGQYVDISARGSSIYTTLDGGNYGYVSGTSFSAPITASVLNLIFSADPSLTAGEAYTILLDTSVDLGDPGWDQYFGQGRVDAQAAVLAASNNLESIDGTPQNFKVAFIGDQGSNSNSESVLQLIADENADMVLHQGDFDYADNPTAWDNQINTFLPGVPYFASVGNHDMAQWSGYQTILQNRLTNIPGAVCTGDLGVKSSCHYQGLFFVLSGVGTNSAYTENDYVTHLQTELANDDSIWSICSWHKNQNAMQVGGKGNEVGWNAYEACKDGGAIIASAHEHSYERTKTLSNTQTQTIDASWSDPNDVRVAQGSTFVFVSGLGGQSIRDQERCTPDDYPYGCTEWANLYTSNQSANHGALFCVFNVDSQEDRAFCYFKNIAGNVVDSFYVTSFMGNSNPSSPPNNAPTASNQSVSTDEDISLGITLSSSDPDADLLAYSIVSTPQNGSISGTGPYLVYTPDLNFAGDDSFTFKTNDGKVDSNTATVSLTVDPIILPPGTVVVRINSGSDDAEETISDGSMYITSSDIELVDDLSTNGEQIVGLRFNGVEVPQGKTITSAYIEFETDEIETVSTSLVIFAQDSDNAATFSTNAADISSRSPTSLSVSWNNIPSWNTLDQKHQTPDITALVQEVVNRTGWTTGNSMAFIIDGSGTRTAESYEGEATAAALLHIEFDTATPNTPPVADPQSVSTDEDTALPITLTATDDDGDPLTFSVVANPSNGSLTGSEPNLTYTPNSDFNGSDIFTFKANDGTDDSNIATVSITVNAINEAHLENMTGESNGKKRWTGTITITVFDQSEIPYFGATVLGTWQGGPDENCITDAQGQCQVSEATKADSQTFTVNDISGSGMTYYSSANHVNSSITINKDGTIPGNTPPVADPQSISTTVNIPLGIILTASDIDGDPLVYGVESAPTYGSLSGTEPNLTYTPNSDFEGADSFTFKANDGTDDSNIATVSITVTPINDPPIANDDSTFTDEDSATTVVVLTNDSDPDGDSFFISSFEGTSTLGASISDNGDGTFNYDPTTSFSLQSLNNGESQDDTFSYTIEDEHGATDSALVTITVSGADDTPSTLSITSISPNSVTRGDTGVLIQVFGTGFSPSSTVSLENGSGPLPSITNTSFQSPGLLEITINIQSNGPKTTAWDLRVTDGVDSVILADALSIVK